AWLSRADRRLCGLCCFDWRRFVGMDVRKTKRELHRERVDNRLCFCGPGVAPLSLVLRVAGSFLVLNTGPSRHISNSGRLPDVPDLARRCAESGPENEGGDLRAGVGSLCVDGLVAEEKEIIRRLRGLRQWKKDPSHWPIELPV